MIKTNKVEIMIESKTPLIWSGEERQVERSRRKDATIFRKFILKEENMFLL